MRPGAETGTPQPRTIAWLNTAIRNLAQPDTTGTFSRASLAMHSKTELQTYSSDEILEVVKTSLNALTRSPDRNLRNIILLLLGSTIPFNKINDTNKLTTTYVQSLTALSVDTSSDNVVAVIHAGIRLANGFPKREDTYRKIANALNTLTRPEDEEVTKAALATKQKLKDDIIKYYKEKASPSDDSRTAAVLEDRLDDPNIKPQQIARKRYLSLDRTEQIIKDLEDSGILESKTGRERSRNKAKPSKK